MKFFSINNFKGSSLGDVVHYLGKDIGGSLRELFIGLNKLSFEDNFEGFLANKDIATTTTVTITNPLGAIPRYRVILQAKPITAGTVIIDDSLTDWSKEAVYLRNMGTATARVTVFFMR